MVTLPQIAPQDEETIKRITGLSEIPDDIRKEYMMRASMYHGDGNTGPLRTAMLIDLVRFLGYSKPEIKPSVNKVDWRNYPQDGSVRVFARFFGNDMPGVFKGFVESGTLAILLDGDDYIRECRPDMVSIATESAVKSMSIGITATSEFIPKDASRDTVSPSASQDTDDKDKDKDAKPVAGKHGKKKQGKPEKTSKDEEASTELKSGMEVWVKYGDDTLDAVVEAEPKDGFCKVLAEIDNGERVSLDLPVSQILSVGNRH